MLLWQNASNCGSKVDVASQSVKQACSWLLAQSSISVQTSPVPSSLLYRIPVFCSQEDDDGDFKGGGGFMEWSPSPSPASTLTHYIHNNKSEMIFLAYPNLYCQAYRYYSYSTASCGLVSCTSTFSEGTNGAHIITGRH